MMIVVSRGYTYLLYFLEVYKNCWDILWGLKKRKIIESERVLSVSLD